jgi:hypothetical protein
MASERAACAAAGPLPHLEIGKCVFGDKDPFANQIVDQCWDGNTCRVTGYGWENKYGVYITRLVSIEQIKPKGGDEKQLDKHMDRMLDEAEHSKPCAPRGPSSPEKAPESINAALAGGFICGARNE